MQAASPSAPEDDPRRSVLEVTSMERPALVIVNPRAGRKLSLSTIGRVIARLFRKTEDASDPIESALAQVGVPCEIVRTKRAGHATELARAAVVEGRPLVIAAGGDGTVEEVAQ